MRIRNEVHTRCDFASKQFDYYTNRLTEWKRTGGSIVGNNPQKYLKKLNQANRVWYYYSKEFGTTLKTINQIT